MAGERLVALAEIARPHGVRGELKLKVYNRDSDLLLDAEEVVLESPEGKREVRAVGHSRWANDAMLMMLVGCNDRDQADALRGTKVLLSRELFPELEAGEFYACDVEGATMVDPEGEVGTVLRLQSYPTCDVLVVATEKGEVEVPLVDPFVDEVDIAKKIVRIKSRSEIFAS
jgi:16S rRNA processing protein RimM